jgi:hypothetical protein
MRANLPTAKQDYELRKQVCNFRKVERCWQMASQENKSTSGPAYQIQASELSIKNRVE